MNDDDKTASTEMVICFKRFKRRQWFDDDYCSIAELQYDPTTIADLIRKTASAETVTETAVVGISPDETGENPAESSAAGRDDRGVIREKYGPGEPAGTFIIHCTAFNGVPKTKRAMEIMVWKTASDNRRVLWFTARKEMTLEAAIAVKTLEIWTDRNNGLPLKTVFLRK